MSVPTRDSTPTAAIGLGYQLAFGQKLRPFASTCGPAAYRREVFASP